MKKQRQGSARLHGGRTELNAPHPFRCTKLIPIYPVAARSHTWQERLTSITGGGQQQLVRGEVNYALQVTYRWIPQPCRCEQLRGKTNDE